MVLFTSFLFTNVISSTVGSLVCPYRCQPNEQKKHCVELVQPKGQVIYFAMLTCAMMELKCDAGEEAKLSSVTMSKCYPGRPKRVKREDLFTHNVEEDNMYKVTESMNNHKECPSDCPTSSDMVCARCNHGIYRSFLSACHLRMYQCRYPIERLELISRHSCYGSAPYMMDGNKSQDVEDTLHNTVAHKGVKKEKMVALAGVLHESDFWTAPHPKPRTPKPIVHVTWPSRRTRTKSFTPTMSHSTSKRTNRPTTPIRTTPKTSVSTTTTTQVTTSTTAVLSLSNEDNEEYKPQVDEAVLMIKTLETTIKDLMDIIPNQIYNNEKFEHCLNKPRKLLKKLTSDQCSENEEEMRHANNGARGKRRWTVHPF